jgi:hypothetical protein
MSDETQRLERELVAAGKRALRELPDAPAAMLRRAEAIFPAAPGLLRRIQALLSIDSWATPLPALRSSAGGARQLLYTSETRDIDLRIVPGASGWTLEGQVLGPADEASLNVQRDGEQLALVALDELGAFHLDGLGDGSYELVLYFRDERLELPRLDIRERDVS